MIVKPMIPTNVNPVLAARREQFERFVTQDSIWQDRVEDLLRRLDTDFADIDDLIDLTIESKRLAMVFAAGLENDRGFYADVKDAKTLDWAEMGKPPVDEELQTQLADGLYFQDVNPNEDAATLLLGQGSRVVGRHMVERCIADGIPFDILTGGRRIKLDNFGRAIINHVSEDNLDSLAAEVVSSFTSATKILSAMPAKPDIPLIKLDDEKSEKFEPRLKPIKDRLSAGKLDFCLTKIPTRADAKTDDIPYDEMVQLFFEMCNQPWDYIDTAHEKLIGKLDKAKTIRIRNDDGTDISMSLVDHDGTPFTFCNSLTGRNYPGSEVFSAPNRTGVNGTIVAKGTFAREPGKEIKNLTMNFVNGYLESFSADEGAEHFKEYLDRDPNNRYIGELGIGTNPHLKRHVLNGLLVEKIGGSFHVALGDAYRNKTYMGKPVHIDNGNATKSIDHWDITTMLFGKGGSIVIDEGLDTEETLMNDGKFLDPDLAVLNDGWFAVPHEDRPEYWQKWCAAHRNYDEVALEQAGWHHEAA